MMLPLLLEKTNPLNGGDFFCHYWSFPFYADIYIYMLEKKLHCKICGEELNENNSTKILNLWRCKQCYNLHTQTRYRRISKEKKYWGGDLRIYSPAQIKNKPGEWCDDQQKKEVTDILFSIGWKYNEKNNVWFDGKIKDKYGNWIKETNGIKNIYHSKYRTFIKENVISIPKVEYKTKKDRPNMLSDEEIQRIQTLYFLESFPKKALVNLLQVDQKEIEWVIMTTMKKLRIIVKRYGKE